MAKAKSKYDFFYQYPRTPVKTSQGDVDMPILYFDNSVMMSMFLVDYDKAQALLEEQGLNAIRATPKKALAGIAFYEYRDSTINDYNEVGVAIACVPKGVPMPKIPALSPLRSLDKAPVGMHIIDLPVTTELACAAGREIWTFPKFVTPINFKLKGNTFEGSVMEPDSDKSIVTLSGKMGFGVPSPLVDLILYTRHEGKMLRTLVNTRGGAKTCLAGSLKVKVSDSDHPMAERLRYLGLDGAKPLGAFHSYKLQLRLNSGAEISA